MVLEEKTISTKEIFKGKIIDVSVETVSLPNGDIAEREIVRHPGGVGILAITDDDKIILVKQYRKPYDKAIYEIPAGKRDKGEDIKLCGRRELLEETGATAEHFEYLCAFYPSPGFTDEIDHLYLAKGLKFGEANPDEDEFLDIEFFPIEKVYEMIMNNEINDGKTITGFLMAMEKLKGGK